MNNYQGYLLAFNGNIIPNSYFLEYSSTPNQRLDTSAERDNTGYLQRTTLPTGKTSITFSTHILHLDEKIKLQNLINRAIVNQAQRKVFIEYWNDEINNYASGYFYLPDIQFQIIDASDTDVLYNPISFELVEY